MSPNRFSVLDTIPVFPYPGTLGYGTDVTYIDEYDGNDIYCPWTSRTYHTGVMVRLTYRDMVVQGVLPTTVYIQYLTSVNKELNENVRTLRRSKKDIQKKLTKTKNDIQEHKSHLRGMNRRIRELQNELKTMQNHNKNYNFNLATYLDEQKHGVAKTDDSPLSPAELTDDTDNEMSSFSNRYDYDLSIDIPETHPADQLPSNVRQVYYDVENAFDTNDERLVSNYNLSAPISAEIINQPFTGGFYSYFSHRHINEY